MFTDVTVGPATFSIGTLAVCAWLVLIDYQSVWFALLSEAFASREGLLPDDRRVTSSGGGPLPRWAGTVGTAAVGRAAGTLIAKPQVGTSSLSTRHARCGVILPSVTILVLGLQTALCSLLLSILGLPSARPRSECVVSSPATRWHEALDRLIRDWRIGWSSAPCPLRARVLDVGCHDGALFRRLGTGVA